MKSKLTDATKSQERKFEAEFDPALLARAEIIGQSAKRAGLIRRRSDKSELQLTSLSLRKLSAH